MQPVVLFSIIAKTHVVPSPPERFSICHWSLGRTVQTDLHMSCRATIRVEPMADWLGGALFENQWWSAIDKILKVSVVLDSHMAPLDDVVIAEKIVTGKGEDRIGNRWFDRSVHLDRFLSILQKQNSREAILLIAFTSTFSFPISPFSPSFPFSPPPTSSSIFIYMPPVTFWCIKRRKQWSCSQKGFADTDMSNK